MAHEISRRALLIGGAGLAAGVGLAAAGCGTSTTTTEKTGKQGTSASATPGPDELQVLIASAQLVTGNDQRFALGALGINGEPLPPNTALQVAFGRTPSGLGQKRQAELHTQGVEDRPYYLVRQRFDGAGEWSVQASAGGKQGTAAFQVIDARTSQVPLVGQKMLPVATPTLGDNRGVSPICTRQPPCPFHQVSLDQAVRDARPVAALFATPALCQSRVCGPVLEVLINESARFANQVRFVHVEVYKSLQTNFTEEDLSPAMRAYHLTFEPVLFLADASGVIRERFDGPYDRVECRDALTRLGGQA